MLVSELFEGLGQERHAEREWRGEANAQVQQGVFALYNKAGTIVRNELSAAAAKALQVRPDLVKKYGKLFIRRIS